CPPNPPPIQPMNHPKVLKFSFLPAVPQCPSPPAIANGKPSIQASAVFNSGTSVNYSCEPGYSLTGQASIYCTASGVWSPPPPRCEEVLCIAPEIQNGRKVAGHGPVYRHRDTVRFECDPGYTLIGSRQIHECQTDDTWDPPLPVCEPGSLCLSHLEMGTGSGLYSITSWSTAAFAGTSASSAEFHNLYQL
uniref:Sushi domain-containing protein n=1 Tax=Gopherus evgoodei TaxID=1825980 RepID=A0A8C4VQ89_9SAUR